MTASSPRRGVGRIGFVLVATAGLVVSGAALHAAGPAAPQPAAPRAVDKPGTTQPTSKPATTRAAGNPATQPITTAKGPLGDLLRMWWAEGTAAGNVGDHYDNRDRGHSELNRAPYPQLGKVSYTKEVLERRGDWAAQHMLLNGVVFGNSSTSAPITSGGSNVRMYYTHPRGLNFLFAQYVKGNLYIYPEHQDHDPGHNGRGPGGQTGYGDVYPTNTPYLIASQGSSGSDQPFMKAVPFTLAAFRPEVKQKLVEAGLLMPTVQMILRSTLKNARGPGDYLTAKAHPTVFEGSNVDDLAMVRMAHAMTADALPPIALLKVEAEDAFENGRDFFEPPGATEKHADTPCVVARIWRAVAGTRRIVVSAAQSSDANKRPLKYHWALLRGDERRVAIKPLDEAGSRVEITLKYPERRPVAPGSPLESNRVDVAAFVHNGVYYSPPAFVTFFALDSEGRTYDASGRVLEIGYGTGEASLSVSNWPALFDALGAADPAPGARWLKSLLKPEDAAGIVKLAPLYKDRSAARDAKGAKEVVETKQPGMPAPAKELVEGALRTAAAPPGFAREQRELIEAAMGAAEAPKKKAYADARARLAQYRIAKEGPGEGVEWTPLLAGEGAAEGRLTRFEASQVQRFNAEVIAGLLLPGVVSANYRPWYVDPHLSRPKGWRDLYQYDAAGKPAGWTRLGLEKPCEFAPDGRLVLEKDGDGKPVKTAAVRYEQAPAPSGAGRPGPNWSPLKQVTEP